MKKMLSLIAGIIITATSFAQITEGKVTYSVDFKTSDPAVEAQLSMLKGSTSATYFSPDFTRTEMNMGMFVQNQTIIDVKNKQTLMMMSGMMGKKASLMPFKENKEEEFEVTVEKTSETKKIAGYKCTKFIVTTEEGAALNIWTTEELVASKDGMKMMNNKISGFPLQFEVDAQQMMLVFTATDVEKNLKKYNKKDLFNMEIPADYEKIAPEDWKGIGM
jgi:hypothetical protein